MLLNHEDNELSFNNTDAFLLLEEPSTTVPTASGSQKFKTRGRKRLPRVSKIQQVLNNLPPGVTYIGHDGEMTEVNVMSYARNPAGYNDSMNHRWADQCIFEHP